MNRLQYLLTKLAEEAAEVTQIALKTQQFGLDEGCTPDGLSNKDLCHQELDDLNGTIKLLKEEFDFNYVINNKKVIDKGIKINTYYEYSKSLGMVE